MSRAIHPAAYRRSILIAALVAMLTWWGFGLPYSMLAWLLDERQLRWTLSTPHRCTGARNAATASADLRRGDD
jgi:hypothetical protein